ncbi:MAG: hypothetical protein R3D03_23735 [Geminicoccaceae bacterium]
MIGRGNVGVFLDDIVDEIAGEACKMTVCENFAAGQVKSVRQLSVSFHAMHEG